MGPSAARREMAQIAARQGLPSTRGARWLANGRSRPTFAALAAMPRWPVLNDGLRRKVAMVALLISSQSSLSRLIDGAQLRAYAMLVGAGLFERILLHEVGGREPLPAPDAMPGAAQALLAQAGEDGGACHWLAQAETLMKEMDAWPST